MDKNPNVFVKVDLLLQEDSYEALKNFLSQNVEIKNMYSLEYDLARNEIVPTSYASVFKGVFSALTGDRLANGYMHLSLEGLKKLLGLS